MSNAAAEVPDAAARPPRGPGAPAPEAWRNVAGYAMAAGLALAVAVWALRLWRADLAVPLEYSGDNLFMQMIVRNTLDEGWCQDSGRLGAPGVLNLRDFPIPDVLHCGVIKLLLLAFRDPVLALNLHALLPFPLTALSAYFVFRRLRLGRLAALVPAVLYACLTYHFLRMKCHQFLAAYYLLPPMIWLALRLHMGRLPFREANGAGGRPRWRFVSWQAAGAAVLCVLTGLAGVYYAFFSCFFLLAAGVRAAFRDREWAPAGAAAVLAALVAAAVGAATSPTMAYSARQGRNAGIAARLPAEADIYGLEVSEMLLPVPKHRVPALGRLQEKYLAPPRRPTGEWPFESLGVLGSLGFLYLFGRFLWRRHEEAGRIDDALAYLNVAAAGLGTVGGLGCLFAFYVTPMIRCYNRLSVCIAFFALAALFLLVQRLAARYVKGRWSMTAYAVGMAGLLLLGALDQTSPIFVPHYADIRREYASDEDFARRIEAALPAGSMVYQMPYVAFPECPPVESLTDYELLRPFLHTRTLRFSYGAMRGREPDRWQAELATRPLPQAVEMLAFADFRGVYLDRAGFADRGVAREAELTRLLGGPPLVSRTGRQSFFDLTAYVESLRGRFTEAEWEARKDELLHPVELRWAGAFLGPEQSPAEGAWRWCGAEGELHVVNPSRTPRRVVLKMQCSGLWDQHAPSQLVVDGPAGRLELTLTAERIPLELDVPAPPGETVLHFSCDGPPRATDGGAVVFRLWDFEYRVQE